MFPSLYLFEELSLIFLFAAFICSRRLPSQSCINFQEVEIIFFFFVFSKSCPSFFFWLRTFALTDQGSSFSFLDKIRKVLGSNPDKGKIISLTAALRLFFECSFVN